ncbi:MAG TPA: hypothetical protein VNC50_11590, partial [Planctomycetia bacterium]|nr:hypothetical protein [Planctomycetia bacterium]
MTVADDRFHWRRLLIAGAVGAAFVVAVRCFRDRDAESPRAVANPMFESTTLTPGLAAPGEWEFGDGMHRRLAVVDRRVAGGLRKHGMRLIDLVARRDGPMQPDAPGRKYVFLKDGKLTVAAREGSEFRTLREFRLPGAGRVSWNFFRYLNSGETKCFLGGSIETGTPLEGSAPAKDPAPSVMFKGEPRTPLRTIVCRIDLESGATKIIEDCGLFHSDVCPRREIVAWLGSGGRSVVLQSFDGARRDISLPFSAGSLQLDPDGSE